MHPYKENSQPSQKSRTATVAGYAVPIVGFLVLLGGLIFGMVQWSQPPSTRSPDISGTESKSANNSLEPAGNWQANNHVHGLAVNPEDPQVIFVATHNGLLKRSDAGEWFWVQPQQERADYMGFTGDLNNPDRFYASGHPQVGGNLGFVISQNQGQDWQQISMPGVDFHALAIAPSDPSVFYGFAASGTQGLFTSTDSGQTWSPLPAMGLDVAPFGLSVDPQDPQRVFAATQAGLYESTDSGKSWSQVAGSQNEPVAGLALLSQKGQTVLVGYRFLEAEPGLYQSRDGGKTWQKLGDSPQEPLLYLTAAPNNPQLLYGASQSNTIFQSQDGGKTWQKLS